MSDDATREWERAAIEHDTALTVSARRAVGAVEREMARAAAGTEGNLADVLGDLEVVHGVRLVLDSEGAVRVGGDGLSALARFLGRKQRAQ